MCIVDSITHSCSHIENIYSIECGTAGNRCAKQINHSKSNSACRRCLASVSAEERKNVISDFYYNVQFYLTNALEITDKFDHDVLAPQVQDIVKLMEDKKSFALLELELKIACEAQKKREYHEDPSTWF
ncbi:hypothetical protein MKX08_004207 [Trichoderma sp. CBMAI-0020]|nr:hypothetical protein MKX08_004207 [Trichoderma sp. CBMAI-0020]